MAPPKKALEDRFFKNVSKTDNCWEWIGGKFRDGYGRFWFNGKSTVAHRVSFIIHFGEIQDGLLVCHKCDNKQCVNPEHFFLGTHKDNSDDMVSKGRHAKIGPRNYGESNGSARFTEAQILNILNDKRKYKDIAEDYGISRQYVGRIKRGELWPNVNEKYLASS